MILPLKMRKNGAKGDIAERRIVRPLGRKDKHSKICTSKGARDRRIRLSANTAIQFYDVQDRLGYDQPSNAIDWLMKEAKSAIDVLNADHYHHHLQELVQPDTTAYAYNPSEAFHPTPGARDQHNLNHNNTNGFNNYPFQAISSRNGNELQEENVIPVPQDINFLCAKPPLHLAWNTCYNAGERFEFVNKERLLSNLHPPVVHTPNNEFTNDDHELLGFAFEHEIQVQEEVTDSSFCI